MTPHDWVPWAVNYGLECRRCPAVRQRWSQDRAEYEDTMEVWINPFDGGHGWTKVSGGCEDVEAFMAAAEVLAS